MTVKELRELLRREPQEAIVSVEINGHEERASKVIRWQLVREGTKEETVMVNICGGPRA